MLRDTAVERIKRRLIHREGSTLDSEIVDALQDAQGRLEDDGFLPWFLQTEVSSILTTADDERLIIPSDFIREVDEDALWYYNGSAESASDVWTPLPKDDIDNLRGAYPGEGPPEGYALDGNYFRLFPTPDDAYTIKMIYFAHDTVLSTNIENKWLKYAPRWLMSEAGADIAYSIGMDKAGERFEQQAEVARKKLFVETTAREEAGRRRSRGGAT